MSKKTNGETESPLPAKFVVASFIETEKMLVEVLDVIPYCEKHLKVWSPRFATILLEACSQLDSLWKFLLDPDPASENDLTMKHYAHHFSDLLSEVWTVFFGSEEPQVLHPFSDWKEAKCTEGTDTKSLKWWNAYNKVKHDRLHERTTATLEQAVLALCGLFVAIVNSDDCRNAIEEAEWVTGRGYWDIEPYLGRDTFVKGGTCVSISSRLFSYAVGAGQDPVENLGWWNPSVADRLRWWHDDYRKAKEAAQ